MLMADDKPAALSSLSPLAVPLLLKPRSRGLPIGAVEAAHPRAFSAPGDLPDEVPLRPGERQCHIPPPPGMLTGTAPSLPS